MTSPLNMKSVSECADELKNFEAQFLNKMLHTRDMLWQTFGGEFPTPEDQKKYDDLNSKCVALQRFTDSIRQTISIAGVSGAAGEDIVRTVSKFHIEDEDGFRSELLSEQQNEMTRVVKNFKSLFEYVSTG